MAKTTSTVLYKGPIVYGRWQYAEELYLADIKQRFLEGTLDDCPKGTTTT